MRAYLETIDDHDDGHWDDWNIPDEPKGQAGPIATEAGGSRELDYSLTREISTLRSLLDRLDARIDEEEDPKRLVLPLTRLVESIARTICIHTGVTGGPESELDELVTRVFRERGLLPE